MDVLCGVFLANVCGSFGHIARPTFGSATRILSLLRRRLENVLQAETEAEFEKLCQKWLSYLGNMAAQQFISTMLR